MGPIVLVLSYGFAKPNEIIKKILNKSTEEDLQQSNEIQINENIKYAVHDYKIKNKYFEIDVKLLPYDEPINTLPKELLKRTEALIVSFESTDKAFLTHVPKLCKLAEDNSIELGLLITGQLFDDCNEGLCYVDVKDLCKHTFDVIETLNQADDDDDDEKIAKATTVEQNYKEIIEALENHVWSNVACSSSSSSCSSSSGGGVKATNNKSQKKVEKKSINDDADDDDELDEAQFETYEALLTNIVNFKNNSTNLNRNQMLDEAEKLAVLFADFMGED